MIEAMRTAVEEMRKVVGEDWFIATAESAKR